MEDHAVYVVVRDGKCLFVQRSKQKKVLPGAWAFASGTVEPGESLFQTAEREAMEEVGMKVKAKKLLTKRDLPDVGVRLNFVICEPLGKPTKLDPAEAEQLAWMSMTDFFDKYTDEQIGHGLRWLRTQPKIWKAEGL
ncbi:NUDIX hydrolase [Candidatus Saccharibacteria bacterium]|nr:NUDIX hydrolase [Candidatus Saccharibacteria bacterium]